MPIAGGPTRVLILDDVPSDAALVERELRRGGLDVITLWVETEPEFVAALADFKPDIVLSDYSLPSFNGMDALQLVQQHSPTTPLIIVTGSLTEETAAECIKAGAADYVLKERLARLLPAVRGALERQRLADDKRRAEEALRESEERYRLIFDKGLDAVLLTAPDGRIFAANPAACRMFGREEREICELGRDGVTDVTDPRLATALEQRARTGSFSAELIGLRSDGAKFPIEVSSSLFEDRSGNLRTSMIIRDISEHRRAAAAMLESENQLRAMFEVASVGIAQADPRTGRWVRVNLKMCAITGYTEEELLGLRVRDITHPDDRQEDWEAFQRVVRGETPDYRLEKRYVRKDGSIVWVNVNMTVINGEDGSPVRTIATIEDITERRRAEETLRESEERYRDLVESSSDLICTHDLDGTLLSANAAAMRISGFQVDSFGTFNLRDLVAPRDRASVDAYLEVIRREGSATGVMKVITRSGEVRYWEYRNSLRTEGVPTPVVRGVARDITERKLAEKALRESEERYRTLVAYSPDGIFLVDLKGNFLSVNETICRKLGYSEAEMLAMSFWDIVPEGQWETHKTRLARILEGGTSDDTVQYEVRAKAGQLVPVEVRSAPYRKGEEIVGFQAIARDITERKRAEEDLQRSRQIIEGILNAIPVRVFWKDKNLVYLGCNAVFARDAGFADPKDLIGKDDYQMGWRDQAEAYRADDREVIESGCFKALKEEPLTTPEGNTMTLLTSKLPLRDSSGEVSGVLGAYLDITEHKRAEEALRQSEARFKAAFASSPIGLALVAPDGRYLEVNAAFCQIVGYSEEEVLGKAFQEITHPDDLASDLAHVRQVLAGEISTYQMEKRYLHKQGQVVWVLLSVALVRDRAGQPLYFVSQAQDVTERKLAVQALRDSEERFRLMAENTADVIWTLDLATRRFTYVSPSIERLRGFTPEEVLAQPFELNLTPDSLVRVEAHLATALAGLAAGDQSGRSLTMEVDQPTKQGGTVRTEIVASALTDASGRVTSVLGVTRDLTERQRGEQALQLRDSALVATANAVVITDSGLRIEWANPAFTQLTGYDLEDVRGQNQRFRSGVQDAAFYEELQRTIQSGSVWHGELVNRRKDGTLYSEEMTITPVRGTSGAITHFIAIKQDITERKTLEEQLRQSQKMEAVGQLAGGVAHDFNNLLQAMLSLTQMLVGHLSDPERLKTDAAELEQQVRRGAALTRQLLLFSRRETVRPGRLDLNEVVRDGLTLLRRLLKANVAIEASLADGQLPVEADRGQLGQVLINLAVNAGDAMPDGGRLALETGAESGAVWLKVTDTGGGIPAAIREHIFEPFFTTKGPGKGTGLGLSVVHGIVTQHGGTVTFERHEGQGTTFVVTLPRAGSGESPAVEIGEQGGASPRGHGELVLVVEDEDAARQALAEMLTMLGYAVTAVGSGEEAGRLAPEKAFDVLLTDLMLPGITGGELAIGLQARWPDLRVVLMSGYTEDEAVRLASRTGTVRFLQKPFDMDTLSRELRAALGSSR